VQGSHSLAIDEMHAHTPITSVGSLTTLTFVANKKGVYQYYSYIPQDRKKVMKGTIIVQ
jgi:plastocyanin